MANVDEILKSLKDGLAGIAKDAVKGNLDSVKGELNEIKEWMEGDVKTWTQMLANGELTKQDFQDNLNSQKDLLKLVVLKIQGKILISADKFTSSIIDLVSSTVTKLIPL
jgi:hypothetical protein